MRRLALVVALLATLALSPGVAVAGPAAAGSAVDGASATGAVAADSDIAAVNTRAVDAQMTTTAVTGADAFAQSTVEPGATHTTNIIVQLRADRDARWRIEMRYPLDSANETAAFREYGESFERGDADSALDTETFEYLAGASSAVANRQMAIQNVSRSATVDDDIGVLRLSFTWTAFLSSDGEHLILRDAFRLPDGRTWLGTLDSNQQLVVRTPPGYAINSTNAPVVQRSGSVIIDGPRMFDTDGPLTIRYEPRTDVAGYPRELVAGIGVAIVLVLAMLGWRRRSVSEPEPHGAAENAGQSDTEAGASETGDTQSGEHAVDDTRPETGAGAGVVDAATDEADSTDEPGESTEEDTDVEQTEEPDPSLLSDEERVEKLLERRGGRMRQAEIVETTGWSDAKVSQLLSSMVEDDRIKKLRLGRENLISLPDDDSD